MTVDRKKIASAQVRQGQRARRFSIAGMGLSRPYQRRCCGVCCVCGAAKALFAAAAFAPSPLRRVEQFARHDPRVHKKCLVGFLLFESRMR
jgi:hypothetical protein